MPFFNPQKSTTCKVSEDMAVFFLVEGVGYLIFFGYFHTLDSVKEFFDHLFNGLGVFKYGSESVRRTVLAVSPLVKPDVGFIVNVKVLVVIFKMFYKGVDVGTLHFRAEREVASGRTEFAELKI